MMNHVVNVVNEKRVFDDLACKQLLIFMSTELQIKNDCFNILASL